MKEMTIEQKARAYDEALERAKNEYQTHKSFNGFREMLVRIFPSLKENNDEEIRKALINVFATHKDYEMFFGVSVKDIHAWLERQGDPHIACSGEKMDELENEYLKSIPKY